MTRSTPPRRSALAALSLPAASLAALAACSSPPTRAATPTATALASTSGALGTSAAPVAAVPVDPNAPPPASVPLASKYVGGFHLSLPGNEDLQGGLVESLAALDQPAGVKGVLLSGEPSTLEREVVALAYEKASADSASGIRAAVSATPKELLLEFIRGVKGTSQVKAALADDGAQFYGLTQGTFLVRDQRVTKATAMEDDLATIERLLRLAETTARCLGTVCAAVDEEGVDRGAIVLDGPLSALRIAGVFDLDQRPNAPATTKAAVVAASKDTSSTARAVADVEHAVILGEAPLSSSGGTHGIVRIEAETGTQTLEVVVDGPLTLVLPLFYFDITGLEPELPVLDVRFLDADGDGRTEVLLRRTSSPYPGEGSATMIGLVRAPTSLRGAMPSEPELDPTFDPWMVRAKSADAAVAAVLAAQPMAIQPADACAILEQLGTPQGVSRYASPDAIFLSFQEPGLPSFAAARRISPLSKASPSDRTAYFTPCEWLRCEGNFCTLKIEPPGSGHAWFERDASGKPRVTAVAGYGGS